MSQVFAIWENVFRRAALVASAQYAAAEHLLVKSKRSLDVGDGGNGATVNPSFGGI